MKEISIEGVGIVSIQIFILSNLMVENSYPYKLKKKIADFQLLDLNNSLTESKLYYHFESLRKSGLIEVQEILQEENRPDKQVFRITEKGIAEFPEIVYKLFQQANSIGEMAVGIGNVKYVDRQIVLEILRKRLLKEQNNWKVISSFDSDAYMTDGRQGVINFMSAYAEERHEMTIRYFERLIEEIQKEEI